ncbi:nuclease-related domain-containing protein [Jeotgalibacillus sp. R-1-5s-1]|uniref:nuclease-related domain-containing protein n=1 Tax=Jeotgalibacillus sp. R-1-5s-1 TaxID=2555897 RepID=UPI00106A1898|nr:nuclease-related domain-containing protein [Jeotgalibacillus sp. R-1-5s-1]TFD94397.1 NERD domain-containing protein [Jeotgalibacillus sp. R-1-5s-1]
MLSFLSLFKKTKKDVPAVQTKQKEVPKSKTNEKVAARKGEIGEYKINIQLDQLPKDCTYLSDLMLKNPKSKSGYSQIDHVVLTPYGIFVIETKNYQGTIYGGKDRKTWLVNGKFKMMNPFVQNYGHIQSLKLLLDHKYHDSFVSMVSFTKRSTFKVDADYRKIASNELIMYDIELSEFINRKISVTKIQHKEPLLSSGDLQGIYQAFSTANISDPHARKEHNELLKKENTPSDSKCNVCNKTVSDKVKNFCLTNQKFKGKIYCYEHQKAVQ